MTIQNTITELKQKIERIEFSLPVITSEETKMKLINQIDEYTKQIEQLKEDESIQKMREMGFPEEMITFEVEKEDINTLDVSNMYPLLNQDNIKTYSIDSDDWNGIMELHNNAIDEIMTNTESENDKVVKEHVRKKFYPQLESLTKEQLIHMIIEHEMTLNSITDELGLLDQNKEDK